MTQIDLSPISLFEVAGPVGKAVMLLLLATSVWCWTIIATSAFAFWRLQSGLSQLDPPAAADAAATVPAAASGPERTDKDGAAEKPQDAGTVYGRAIAIAIRLQASCMAAYAMLASRLAAAEEDYAAGLKEAGHKCAESQLWGETPTEKYRRIREAMENAAAQLVSSRAGRISDLALIANIAPFIGLFGTVWGIIGSFAAIAGANDTSLSTVAPGIAEALAATAYGLAVAIPASIAYNQLGVAFTGAATRLKLRVPQLAVEVVSIGKKP